MSFEFTTGGDLNPYIVSTGQTLYINTGQFAPISGGYIYGGGPIGSGSTSAGCITVPATSTTLDILAAPRRNNISQAQLAYLLAEHRFMEMDSCDYCLFCFALDMYRTRAEHLFVIREE